MFKEITKLNNRIGVLNNEIRSDFDNLKLINFENDNNIIKQSCASIQKSYNDFIITGTGKKVVEFFTVPSGKLADDEKHNQKCIDNVKQQVKIINGCLQKYSIKSISTSVIKADNTFEHIGEVFTGDGYYLKGKIGEVISKINKSLTSYNKTVDYINRYYIELNDIATSLDYAIDDLTDVKRKLKKCDIVSYGESVVNAYISKIDDTKDNLIALKKNIKIFTNDHCEIGHIQKMSV